VRVEPGSLSSSAGVTVPGARIQVRDTGCGMAAEAIEHAFEPFFTTRAPDGTGLGLAVVKGIVDDHQGRIRVHSQEGRGTTFVVDLPCNEQGERTMEVADGPA